MRKTPCDNCSGSHPQCRVSRLFSFPHFHFISLSLPCGCFPTFEMNMRQSSSRFLSRNGASRCFSPFLLSPEGHFVLGSSEYERCDRVTRNPPKESPIILFYPTRVLSEFPQPRCRRCQRRQQLCVLCFAWQQVKASSARCPSRTAVSRHLKKLTGFPEERKHKRRTR